MARASDPDSASSQFFIVVKDSPFLDRQYTAFGEVVKGMEVVDKIVAESNSDPPTRRAGNPGATRRSSRSSSSTTRPPTAAEN